MISGGRRINDDLSTELMTGQEVSAVTSAYDSFIKEYKNVYERLSAVCNENGKYPVTMVDTELAIETLTQAGKIDVKYAVITDMLGGMDELVRDKHEMGMSIADETSDLLAASKILNSLG